MPELRPYNLLRQSTHHYECIPSEFIALALRRDEERKARLNKATRVVDRIIWGLVILGLAYMTWQVGAWVVKP